MNSEFENSEFENPSLVDKSVANKSVLNVCTFGIQKWPAAFLATQVLFLLMTDTTLRARHGLFCHPYIVTKSRARVTNVQRRQEGAAPEKAEPENPPPNALYPRPYNCTAMYTRQILYR